MSAELITGSCNCGRYKYTVPKPTEMNLCHCLDCRKWAGAMHSAHVFVATKDIDRHDSPEPKTHHMEADSGTSMERAWCNECGCGIWIKVLSKPDTTCFKAGLFDPSDIPNPTQENWLKNLEKWETPARGTKRTSQVN